MEFYKIKEYNILEHHKLKELILLQTKIIKEYIDKNIFELQKLIIHNSKNNMVLDTSKLNIENLLLKLI